MKKAFTLVEVLIVVAILGILAALVIPQFRSHSQQAKEAAAMDNLRILRQQIEVYSARHGGVPPGYANNDTTQNPSFLVFLFHMTSAEHYLSDVPENPFNGNKIIKVIGDAEQFPAEATGEFGWIYKPFTKEVRLDWPGTDKKGIRYYDY